MDLLKNIFLILVFIIATYAWLVLFDLGPENYGENFGSHYKERIPNSILVNIPILGDGIEEEEKKEPAPAF